MCAGDLYEHELYTPDTVQLLQRLFAEVAPIPVLIAPGNHDWYGPGSIYVTADWSPNVHIFGSSDLTPYDGLDGARVWGFAHRNPSQTVNPLGRFEKVEGDALHLGLFHGSEVGGWASVAQSHPEKIRHAPFRAEDIAAAGFVHCIVGHYHSPFMGDFHTYPGAPAPLSFKDQGKGGAVEMRFDARGTVKRTSHKVTNLPVHDLRLNVSGCVDFGEIQDRMEAVLEPLEGVARVTLQGELASAVELDLAVLSQRRGQLHDLAVRVGSLYPGYDVAAIQEESTVRGEFVRDLIAADLDDDERHRVIITGLRALEGRNDLNVG